MNAEILKGKWMQMKGEIKRRWGKLTDDEIDEIDGNLDTLSGKLLEHYGKKRDDVERELKEIERAC